MSKREEITEKYLLMALQELAKHRGAIKKGRMIDQMWHKEMYQYMALYEDPVHIEKTKKQVIKLKKKED